MKRTINCFALIFFLCSHCGAQTNLLSLEELGKKPMHYLDFSWKTKDDLSKYLKTDLKDIYRLTLVSSDTLFFDQSTFPNLQEIELLTKPVPYNIHVFPNLQVLTIRGSLNYYDGDFYHSTINHSMLPENLWKLKNLKIFISTSIGQQLSENISKLENLEYLSVYLSELPASIIHLKHLKIAYLRSRYIYKLYGRDLHTTNDKIFLVKATESIDDPYGFEKVYSPPVTHVFNNRNKLIIYFPRVKKKNLKALEGYFKEGEGDSTWTFRDEENQLAGTKFYVSGKETDSSAYYYTGIYVTETSLSPSVIIKYMGDSTKITRSEVHKQKMYEELYYKNQPVKSVAWDDMGRIRWEINYKNYKLHGKKIIYHYPELLDGKPEKLEQEYNNGIPIYKQNPKINLSLAKAHFNQSLYPDLKVGAIQE